MSTIYKCQKYLKFKNTKNIYNVKIQEISTMYKYKK